MPRPPLTYRITERQWVAIDVAVAVVAAIVIAFGLRVMRVPHFVVPAGPVVAVMMAATLPVAVRRFWPLPVLVVVVTAIAVLTAYGRASLDTDVMLGMALYTAARRLSRPVAVVALVTTEVALGAGLLAATATARMPSLMLHSVLTAAALWFVGDGVRERRRYLAGVAEQEEQGRRAEDERGRRTAGEERLRIARELHDVLAHSLSVVAVQAGVGRRVGAAHPDEALRALRTVEESSRGALDELRRILSLLRGDGSPGPSSIEPPGLGAGSPAGSVLAPAPGLGDLESLADMIRSAGIPVALSVTGETGPVPPAVALTVYRITQEALTNVIRHASGAEADVRIAIGRDGVRIHVADNGSAAARANAGIQAGPARQGPDGQSSGQHGIIGMRERAAAFSGTLEASPAPGGGFEVTAFLPVPDGRRAA